MYFVKYLIENNCYQLLMFCILSSIDSFVIRLGYYSINNISKERDIYRSMEIVVGPIVLYCNSIGKYCNSSVLKSIQVLQ